MTRLLLAIVALLGFTGFTVKVILENGLLGFIPDSDWTLQVFVDLGIATLGFWLLALPDAKRRGINAWPYALAAPLIGSITLLAYFVHREWRALSDVPTEATR